MPRGWRGLGAFLRATASDPTITTLSDRELSDLIGLLSNVRTLAVEEQERRRACRICQLHAPGVVFLPCAHLCVCIHCQARVRTCPSCNRPVSDRLTLAAN